MNALKGGAQADEDSPAARSPAHRASGRGRGQEGRDHHSGHGHELARCASDGPGPEARARADTYQPGPAGRLAALNSKEVMPWRSSVGVHLEVSLSEIPSAISRVR